jgi:hypothetical protein
MNSGTRLTPTGQSAGNSEQLKQSVAESDNEPHFAQLAARNEQQLAAISGH